MAMRCGAAGNGVVTEVWSRWREGAMTRVLSDSEAIGEELAFSLSCCGSQSGLWRRCQERTFSLYSGGRAYHHRQELRQAVRGPRTAPLDRVPSLLLRGDKRRGRGSHRLR